MARLFNSRLGAAHGTKNLTGLQLRELTSWFSCQRAALLVNFHTALYFFPLERANLPRSFSRLFKCALAAHGTMSLASCNNSWAIGGVDAVYLVDLMYDYRDTKVR